MDSTIKNKIFQILLGILAKTGTTRISDDTELATVGLDSISFVRFIVELENTFGIEVLDSDLLITYFSTLPRMYETLDKYFVTINTEPRLFKCVITDCDGVLWEGIAGERDIDQPILTQDTIDTQRTLKFLSDQGVYICICSKNSQENIQSMFCKETPLASSDISIFEWDTSDKSISVENILQALHLSPDNVVFIDDSLYECGLISTVFPPMAVMFTGDYKGCLSAQISTLFKSFPHHLINRTKLYQQQKEREKIHLYAESTGDYNHRLETEIVCYLATYKDASRIAELSQRTNRFNASNIRYTEEQIRNILGNVSYKVYALNAIDIYGDMGLVASAIVCNDVIENFMVSCRVFDRDFENVLIEKVKNDHPQPLKGIYHKTPQNIKCLDFYKNVNIEVIER